MPPSRGARAIQASFDCRITAYTQTSAVGSGLDALRFALEERRSGLRRNDYEDSRVDSWIGRVDGVESIDWTGDRARLESRNNALAELALEQDGFGDEVRRAAERFGAERVGVILGTSTSSIGRTEAAYRKLSEDRMPELFRQPEVHNPASASLYVARLLGLQGPALTVSTACASSARVFASAHRWLEAGVVDAVLAGGVDSLCHSVLNGFESLQLTSPGPCRPFDMRREGISIGEAAGYALLMRAGQAPDARCRLAGYGESSDAYHMSHPRPDGGGAVESMELALGRAGLSPGDIGYANLHGTATRANDAAEALAMAKVFPDGVFASSTKGWTGHTLGAAGIVEAVIAMEALRNGLLPGTLNCDEPDPELDFPVQIENDRRTLRHALSNSFGFGGSNCTLIFSAVDA